MAMRGLVHSSTSFGAVGSAAHSMSRSIDITVIIPAFNAAAYLEQCLKALLGGSRMPAAIIVVDDGSTDDTCEIAARFPVRLLRNPQRSGPACARNFGARAAAGEVLFFLDSDVCVQPDTLEKTGEVLAAEPDVDAVIASYDSEPRSPDFLSQYRNLMHSFVHQSGQRQASTFWSGCGAIRRNVFLEHSGFDETFARPAVEDIELGYRLVRAGRKIVLDRSIQVTHLKHWSFWNLVKTDVCDRGIPWTELILRDRFMPNDLNIQLSQRVSVALVYLLLALCAASALFHGAWSLLPLLVIVFILLSRWWGEFAGPTRPRSAPFLICACVACIAYLAYLQNMFGLIPPLLLSPALLLIRHRYSQPGSAPSWVRWAGLAYAACVVLLAIFYLPSYNYVIAMFLVLALLGFLNSDFYVFLAGKRGVPFMLAAIPFHLLYHFYNGISCAVGLARHLGFRYSSRSLT